jgi:hypothetical protein
MAANAVDVINSVTVSGSYTSTVTFDLSSVTVSDYRFFKMSAVCKSTSGVYGSRGNGYDHILQYFNGNGSTGNYAWGGLLTDASATGGTFITYNTTHANSTRLGRIPNKGKTYNAQTDAWGLVESYIQVTDTDWETTGMAHVMSVGGTKSDGFNSGYYDGAITRGSFWWNNTAVLTSITYDLVSAYFLAGSKFNLYGFKNTA